MNCRILMGILVVLFTSCQEAKNGELPIDMDKAVAILADVHLAEEVAKYYGQDIDSILPIYMDSIFEIHKIDSAQYSTMMGYLEQSVSEYHQLEQKVHDELKKYQAARDVRQIED